MTASRTGEASWAVMYIASEQGAGLDTECPQPSSSLVESNHTLSSREDYYPRPTNRGQTDGLVEDRFVEEWQPAQGAAGAGRAGCQRDKPDAD